MTAVKEEIKNDKISLTLYSMDLDNFFYIIANYKEENGCVSVLQK